MRQNRHNKQMGKGSVEFAEGDAILARSMTEREPETERRMCIR